MIGTVFAVMAAVSLIVSIFTGSLNELSNSIFSSASSALDLTLSLVSVMCLWCGIMNVFEKKGIIEKLSKRISFILRFLFPDAYKRGMCGEISANISANLLGIGNAATPLGISAMKRLHSINPDKTRASDDMVMLAVLNTASIDILPATLISLRQSAGSLMAYDIILPTVISSTLTVIFAVTVTKMFSKVF